MMAANTHSGVVLEDQVGIWDFPPHWSLRRSTCCTYNVSGDHMASQNSHPHPGVTRTPPHPAAHTHTLGVTGGQVGNLDFSLHWEVIRQHTTLPLLEVCQRNPAKTGLKEIQSLIM